MILGISHLDTSTAKLGQNDKQTHASLQDVTTPNTIGCWSAPKDQQNKIDNFLSVTGTLFVIVKNQKDN